MLKGFYDIFGYSITLRDVSGEYLFSYPSASPIYRNMVFCDKLWRLCPEFKEECLACDRRAITHVCKEKEPYVYTCHVGLSEAIVPIVIHDEVRCVFFIGQFRNNANLRLTPKRVTATGAKYGVTPTGTVLSDLQDAYWKQPQVEQNRMEILVNYLRVCAYVIQKENLISVNHSSLTVRFCEYLRENLYQHVSVSSTAEALKCSASHLSRVIAKDLHTTFSAYLNERRIEEAKRLLTTTNLSVKEIAQRLTYEEATYFMHVFKKSTGMTPSSYRKSAPRDHLPPITPADILP